MGALTWRVIALDHTELDGQVFDNEIHENLLSQLFKDLDGHDTTKTAISFCLYALSKHPSIQDKLIEEIDDVVVQKGDDLSLLDYGGMKYMDNVIKEVLRMYTPVPFIARTVSEDITLPNGYKIPVGSEANFFLLFMHNDAQYFKEPEKFMPERFEALEKQNPYEYVPFSAGARNCVGQRFAYTEMRIVLFKFFQNYRLLPATKQASIELETNIVLCSLQGLPVRIVRRN